MSSESVKVCDKEIEILAEVAACWDDIGSVLGKYVAVMKTVHTEAIKDGHIHTAVENLYLYAERFYNCSVGLGGQASSYSKKLVSKIEEVDLNLYNGV